jgi:DNA gyrase subunit A
MATNIPPHNLGEVIDASIAMMENPAMTLEELHADRAGSGLPDRRHDPRPYPASAALMKPAAAPWSDAGQGDGRGGPQGPRALIVTEIPYQVNKSTMIERSPSWCATSASKASPTSATKSDRSGMRVVIELKRDAVADVVLNQLYRFSAADVLRGNMVALNGGKPEQMNLKDMLNAFVAFPRGGHHSAVPSSC